MSTIHNHLQSFIYFLFFPIGAFVFAYYNINLQFQKKKKKKTVAKIGICHAAKIQN